MKVAILTIGCKLNQYESEYLIESLEKSGFVVVDFKDIADIYVINTCTVTSQADSKSRQAIRQARRRNPDSIVVATGCYAEINRDELKKIGADIVVGNVEKVFLSDIIKRYVMEGISECASNLTPDKFYPMPIDDFKDYSRAFVKIQDGCDFRCSYCIVWKARGKSRSADPRFVLDEVKRLVDKGFEEIVLTGVHLGSYGKDIGLTLVDLLEELVKVESLKKIRLSSIEPTEWTDELIDFISHDKIAKHFHIPLQSGSDRILGLMNRNYSRKFFEDLILRINKSVPIAGIGVDVIVGFPTEDEEDFKATYTLLRDLPIYYMHIFTYSDRPATVASSMTPKVLPSVKRKRWETLKELKDIKMDGFVSSFIGRNLEGVIEGRVTEDGLFTRGLSENYIPLLIPGDHRNLKGKVCNFRVVEKRYLNLVAELI